MGKIAVEVQQALRSRERAGGPGRITGRELARGHGWTVEDVVCTSGPGDRPFEEQHAEVSVAIVLVGSFEYRSLAGSDLMTPGSVMLGNPGQSFECGHQHGAGDRCIAFRFAPDYFERLAADALASRGRAGFRVLRIPPIRELAPVVARAAAALAGPVPVPWEELGVRLGARALELANGVPPNRVPLPRGATGRVARTVRLVERELGSELGLGRLASEAGLSPYHFLRTFVRLTGVTPHQYLLRSRLRMAAVRLETERARVIDVALESGFGDLSNFNRAFRAEFGENPRGYRARGSIG